MLKITSAQINLTIGDIAGLGPPEPSRGPLFAQLASTFLDLAPVPGFSWRCAWPGGTSVSSWVERYDRTVARYSRTANVGSLPTIARIWGAIRDDEAAVIVDQDNLRTWVWHDGACVELHDSDPLVRIAHAARLVVG